MEGGQSVRPPERRKINFMRLTEFKNIKNIFRKENHYEKTIVHPYGANPRSYSRR